MLPGDGERLVIYDADTMQINLEDTGNVVRIDVKRPHGVILTATWDNSLLPSLTAGHSLDSGRTSCRGESACTGRSRSSRGNNSIESVGRRLGRPTKPDQKPGGAGLSVALAARTRPNPHQRPEPEKSDRMLSRSQLLRP
jgi:hypothetical protein